MTLWLAKRDVKVGTVPGFFSRRAPVGVVGGIWAMIPDIDYFLEEHMFDKPWADIFLFHHSFDLALPETDLFFAAEMFLLFAVVNLFAMVASVKTFERVNEALFGKKDEEDDDEDEEDEQVVAGYIRAEGEKAEKGFKEQPEKATGEDREGKETELRKQEPVGETKDGEPARDSDE